MSDGAVVRRRLPLPGRLVRRAAPLLLAALAVTPSPARAAELSAFVSGGQPGDKWHHGYGGMLTISLFNIVYGEVEGAWQGSPLPDTSLLTLSAKAYLGPSIGRLVPYGGLGAGLYRENLPNTSDSGTLGSAFLGAKLKFPFGLVLRGEYQWVTLPDSAPVKLEHRYFAAAGLSF